VAETAERAPAPPEVETAGGRDRLPLIGVAVGITSLIVLALLIGPPVIVLIACVASGFGVTYLSGVALNFEERVAFGTVLGGVLFCTISFLLSLAVRDVTLGTVLAAAVLSLGIGAVVAWVHGDMVGADWHDIATRWSPRLSTPGHPWPLFAIVLVCGAWTVHFLHQAWVFRPDGLYAGYINIWGDWAAHLSFAGSFAYGHNFPPQNPVDPGNRLGYPFMADFLAANLVPLGSSLTASLVLSSGLLGLAFPAVLYLAAARFAGGRAAAVIAVAVFLLSGGLGFIYLASDVHTYGLTALLHLQREYTLNRDLNFQWLNPVLAYLVPQRSTLFGFSLALIVLLLVWVAVREHLGAQAFLFAGVVAGLTPAFHVHAYGTIVALSAFWAVFNRRREWWYFFVPALVLGLPVLAWLWPPASNLCIDRTSTMPYCLQPGWLAYSDWTRAGVIWFVPEVIWFWIKNTSLLIPVILAAHIFGRQIPVPFAKWFAPLWLWFIVPSIFILAPWEWDNTKFLIFFALFGAIVAGGFLAEMFKRGPHMATLAAVVLALLVMSGGLDLVRASDFSVSSYEFVDARGVNLAAWVRANTPPDAVIAAADDHNSPIPTLSGRRILVGYPGWLFTYGLSDYVQKGEDLRLIMQGDPTTPDLLRKYHISYILIGPQEQSPDIKANLSYWAQHGTLVYDDGEYRLYQVT
jgi:hypothetical protein